VSTTWLPPTCNSSSFCLKIARKRATPWTSSNKLSPTSCNSRRSLTLIYRNPPGGTAFYHKFGHVKGQEKLASDRYTTALKMIERGRLNTPSRSESLGMCAVKFATASAGLRVIRIHDITRAQVDSSFNPPKNNIEIDAVNSSPDDDCDSTQDRH
jgi:hypothetical protein